MTSFFRLGIKREHFNRWAFEKWRIWERIWVSSSKTMVFSTFLSWWQVCLHTNPACAELWIHQQHVHFKQLVRKQKNINMIQYISIHFNTFSLSDLKAIFVIAFPSLEGSARPDLDGLNQREARQNVCLSGSSLWTTSPERGVSSRAWRVPWWRI